MKLVSLFLVLSLVVLMAEPGDAFLHHIINGFLHVGRAIHGLIHGHNDAEVVELQLDKRSVEYRPGRPGFA